MIDEPGPWATGPFMLSEGYSSLDTEMATINREPFAATWLQREDRAPRARLTANKNYWDKKRGPYLGEIVFRNDLSPERALELVTTTEGEVDILTRVSPADAKKIEDSEYAKLVATGAVSAVAGVIDRDAEGLPLADKRARQALNLAVDRDRLVLETMFGRAEPLAGLTPPSAVTFVHRLSPYSHDADRAAGLWREALDEAGGTQNRPLRIAALGGLEATARRVAGDLRETLGADVEVTNVYRGEDENEARRRLAEKETSREWDILLLEHGAQTADAPPLELHRAFVGESGEFRAGPVVPEFEELYADLPSHTSKAMMSQVSYRLDKFVHEEALALFLIAPQALYAVNRHVDFTPYRTTFELAETRVSEDHWSRRR